MKYWLESLNESIFVGSLDYARGNLTSAGMFGVIGFPLFYPVWEFLFPQPFESLSLRLGGSLLCLPLVFERLYPPRFRGILPYYWFVVLVLALPFFFQFMLFMNGGNTVWLMSFMCSVIILAMLVQWYNFLLIFILGTLIAWLVFSFAGAVSLEFYPFYVIPVFLFLIVAVNILNFKRSVIDRARGELMYSWGWSLVHEVETPITDIRWAANSYRTHIQNTTIPELESLLLKFEKTCDTALKTIKIIQYNTGWKFADDFSPRSLFSAHEFVQRVIDEEYPFKTEVERKLISVREGDFLIHAQQYLLARVLINLMNNSLRSIRDNQGGLVSIEFISDRHWNRILVRDTGLGIPSAYLSRVFDRNFSTRKGREGTHGAGLYFARMAMQHMGGKLKVHSKLGEYAEFTLYLPHPPSAYRDGPDLPAV